MKTAKSANEKPSTASEEVGISNFSFPLYDTLNTTDLPSHDMSSSEKDSLVGKVESLDIEGKETVLILIKKFQAVEGLVSDKLPYGGKKSKKDIKFDISEMPNPLRHLLMKFASLHLNRMEESKNREEAAL